MFYDSPSDFSRAPLRFSVRLLSPLFVVVVGSLVSVLPPVAEVDPRYDEPYDRGAEDPRGDPAHNEREPHDENESVHVRAHPCVHREPPRLSSRALFLTPIHPLENMIGRHQVAQPRCIPKVDRFDEGDCDSPGAHRSTTLPATRRRHSSMANPRSSPNLAFVWRRIAVAAGRADLTPRIVCAASPYEFMFADIRPPQTDWST